jgi:hypothetical protein
MLCDFMKFLAVWNACQGQSTPRVHLKIAHWLQSEYIKPNPRLLLMAFRSCGKSTLVGIFCAWVLYQNPNIRILVLSADLALARKMVRNVKRIIEKHPLTNHLKPDKPDQWGSDKFTIKREQEFRDPSMLAKGIATNLTGTRADIIICDDVEVPKTSDTTEKRIDLRDKLHELDYILTPNGAQIYVGTPHCWQSIYADSPRPELGEQVPFLHGFTRLIQPVLNGKNESVWPERFKRDDIEAILTRTGPAQFQSQMMCQPANIEDARLNPQHLRVYDGELSVHESQGQKIITVNDRRMVGNIAWWDPSFGGERHDKSVLAILYADDDGGYWLQHLAIIRTNSHLDSDEATQQCEEVARILKHHHIVSVAIETNGLGKFLPKVLTRELRVAGVACGVREIVNRKPKAIRIMEAFDAVLAARALHIHRSILKTPFIEEMQDWRPDKKSGYDDCLDAVAGAISLHPVRIQTRPAKTEIEDGKVAEANWVSLPPKTKPRIINSRFDI